MLFRSLVVGLLGACVFLIVERPPPVVVSAVSINTSKPTSADPQQILDVAPGVTGDGLVSLVHLTPIEHVTSVDDRGVYDSADAAARIGAHDSGDYVDITIAHADGSGERRVLLVLH